MNLHRSDGEFEADLSYVALYLAPLRHFLTDDGINELVINPDGSIFVEAAGAPKMHRIEVSMPVEMIKRLGAQLAGDTKNTLGLRNPIVSGQVSVWGYPLRVQIVVDPAVESGVSLSIRKYLMSPPDKMKIGFLQGQQLDVDQERIIRHKQIADLADAGDLQGLFRQAIEERFNILISGGTSSGKTTVARAMIAMSDLEERIITIEDAQELFAPHNNKVALIASRREKSERSPSRLLESCLRMRPDRIILGEIRGAEAYDFLEAINTGHPGAITTIHADSPELALDRLALMVLRSGLQMSYGDIIRYARRTIDLIIQVGRRDGKRGILEIYFPSQHE